MRTLIADVARKCALRNRRKADQIVADAMGRARRANARAEWWTDVREWASVGGRFADIRSRRRRGLRTFVRVVQ